MKFYGISNGEGGVGIGDMIEGDDCQYNVNTDSWEVVSLGLAYEVYYVFKVVNNRIVIINKSKQKR